MQKDEPTYPQASRSEETDFDAFFAQERAPIARYVRMRVRNDADAEDIIAESACQLIAYCRRTERTVTHHRALLYKIANARIADYYAARAHASNPIPIEEADELVAPQSLSRAMEVDDELRRVFDAMAKLRADDREIIVLHAISGLTIGELAEFFDIRAGAVRVRLFRARRALRKAMRDPPG